MSVFRFESKGVLHMKNKTFRLAAFFLCILLMLSFTSCSEVEQAQNSLESMLETLQQGNYTEARDLYVSKMGGDNDFLGCKDSFNAEEFPAYDMHRELFTTMEYKIIETVSDEPAKVTFLAEITTVDLEPIADMLFSTTEGFNFMAENNETQITEEEINAVLTQQMVDISHDYLQSEERKDKTTQIEINVCYEKDRVWRVYPDDNLVNVLTGGVYNRYNMIMQEHLANE